MELSIVVVLCAGAFHEGRDGTGVDGTSTTELGDNRPAAGANPKIEYRQVGREGRLHVRATSRGNAGCFTPTRNSGAPGSCFLPELYMEIVKGCV